MDYEEWLNRAINKTSVLSVGTVFVLKDLFEGVEWNTLTNGERRELGRQFKIKVNRGLVPDIKYYGKAQNNSSKYTKE